MNWQRRTWRYARPFSGSLVAIVALALLGALFSALKPWPLALILDHVLNNVEPPAWYESLPLPAGPASQLLWLAAANIVIIATVELFKLIRLYTQAGAGLRMSQELGRAIFTHIQQLTLSFHGKRATGDLLRRTVKDSTCVQDLIIGVYVPCVTSAANLVFMTLIMLRLDPLLTGIAVSAILPLILAIRFFSNALTDRAVDQEREETQVMTIVERTLGAIPIVQSFAREDYEVTRFRDTANSAYRAHLNLTMSQIGFSFSSSFVIAFATAIMMGIGGWRVFSGALTLGELVVFLSYLAAMYAPVETMALLSTGFYAAKARARRAFELLDHDDTIPDPKDPRPIPGNDSIGNIAFEDITFEYEAGTPIMQKFALKVNTGETIAFVGPTGAGKTSIARLLLRFYDPQHGSVSAGGIDIREFSVDEWRSRIAFVPQEPLLLPMSVRENIAYAKPNASDAEIEAAASAARCNDFIGKLPEGIDTVIGERGATLSGGEKQRLSIARAILRDAPIIILDEPTAALDARTESEVVEALHTLTAKKTSFIIAHRLSTIRSADRICFISEGRIVEQGTYEELVALKGRFWNYTQIDARA